MSYIEFLENIRKVISEKLGDGYSVTSRKVLKNNSVELDSLMIAKIGDCVIPNIYLNQYYLELKAGKSLEEISGIILKVYHDCIDSRIVEEICSYDYTDAEDRIVYRLVNYSRNRELLRESPHMRVEDLAVIFYYLVSESEDGISAIRITYDNIGMFKVTPEELPGLAEKNTPLFFPPRIEEISSILMKLMEKKAEKLQLSVEEEQDFRSTVEKLKELHDERDCRMYVLTNRTGSYGATCLLYDNILEKVHELYNDDFYILPSSVNEVILVRKDEESSVDNLQEMVRTINDREVADEEILSDTVYQYPKCCFKASDLCGRENTEDGENEEST